MTTQKKCSRGQQKKSTLATIETCKKGDVRGPGLGPATEDGWIFLRKVDEDGTIHETFRPPHRTKTHPGITDAWDIQL